MLAADSQMTTSFFILRPATGSEMFGFSIVGNRRSYRLINQRVNWHFGDIVSLGSLGKKKWRKNKHKLA